MQYDGSVSPPQEPPKKKRVIPRRQVSITMSDASTSGAGVKESSLMWPLLTRDNYAKWSMLMQCNFEALEIWGVIDPRINPKRSQDRQAMSALLRSVPKEMWQSLGARPTVKEAWEAVKLMWLGADRVKEVNA